MKRLIPVTLLISMSCLFAGCQLFARPEPWTVNVRGVITHIRLAEPQASDKDIIGIILVEGEKEEDTQYDSADVGVTRGTRIFRNDEQHQRLPFEALEIGQKVEVQFEGPIIETDPPQATAHGIAILE